MCPIVATGAGNAPPCESARPFDADADGDGTTRMPDAGRGLVDGAVRDPRAVVANGRLALTLFCAPPIESARSRDVGTDVMRMPPEARRSPMLVLFASENDQKFFVIRPSNEEGLIRTAAMQRRGRLPVRADKPC